jgi:hypothetical protein
MEYREYSKDEQREFLTAQIRDLETQHFQQTTFADCADAAADAEPPAADELPEGVGTEDHDAYVKNNRLTAFQHRRAAAESERRVHTLRAVLATIEAGKATKNTAKPKQQ